MDKNDIKILAIDDNLDNLITIQALTSESFPNAKVILALTGKEGLQLAAKEDPDVILLDIIMPEMDGFEVCKRLKVDRKLKDIPVVFVTALKGDKESRIKGLDVGAEAFLAKPIDESELVAQIRAMIKIKSAAIQKQTENERLSSLVSEKTNEITVSQTATLNLMEDLKKEIEIRGKSEEALRESEARLIRAELASKSGNWEINIDTKEVRVSMGASIIYGLENKTVTFNDIKNIPLPEYRLMLDIAFKNLIEKNEPYNLEFKILKKDSKEVVDIHSIAFFDKERRIVFGVIQDITEEKTAKEALRISEEKYRFMAENSSDVVWHMDTNFCFDYVSSAQERLNGYTSEEVLGTSLFSLLNPEDVERVMDFIKKKKSLNEKFLPLSSFKFEFEVKTKSGNLIWVEVSISVHVDENGTVAGYHGVTRDVTEKRLAIERLRESEEKFREMANMLPQIIFETDTKGNLMYINQQAYNLAGYGEDDKLIGKHTLELYIPEDRDRAVSNIKARLSGKIEGSNEYTMIRKDGSTFPVLVYSSAIIKNKEPLGLRGIIVDITEQKHAEERIKESESKYYNLFSLLRLMSDTMPDMLWAKDIEGKFIFTNKAYCDDLLNAKDTTEPIGKEGSFFANRERASHPDNPEWHTFGAQCSISDEDTFKNLQMKQFDEFGTVKGKFIFLDVHKAPLFNADNELIGIVGTARDITKRKEIEQALEASRTELKTIYDNAPVMMCVVDENARIQFANRAFTSMSKLSEEELIGGSVGGVIGCIKSLDDPLGCGHGPKCSICKLRNAMEKTLNSGLVQNNIEYQTTIQTTEVTHDISLLVSTALINTNDQKNLLICLVDITDRKISEEALQKSETLLRSFIDNSPFEIWARNNHSVGILENKKFVDLHGSIIGFTPESDTRVDKFTLKRWERVNKRVFAGEIVDEEFEFEVLGEKRNYQQIVFPIKNEYLMLGIAGFNIDITDRIKAQLSLNESQEQLKKFAAHLQNVREEERVMLAREIHDDLGQILIAIKIDLGLLKNSLQKQFESTIPVDLITKFNNLNLLVDNTIKSARRIMTDLRPEVLDLLGFIDTVKQHLKSYSERYNISYVFDNNTTSISLSSQQAVALFRIVQEALNNIAKHAKASKVIVRLTQEKEFLVLQITDNGIGFDYAKAKRIDSYGLLGMKERVYLINGELTVESKPNRGTSIIVKMNKSDVN
jgi:PAS domain S-box-containing protein